MALYAVGGVLGIVVAFIVWRWTSVTRGARKRDQQILPLLEPIAGSLEKSQPLGAGDLEAVASRPYARPLLYALLEHHNRLDLFPARYRDRESHAEGTLMYWMAHPNELAGYPEAMELVETVSHDVSGQRADFLVYKYLMPPGHWARGSGWLLGVVGPYAGPDAYTSSASAFSRAGDKADEVKPVDLVAWYVGLIAGPQPNAGQGDGLAERRARR